MKRPQNISSIISKTGPNDPVVNQVLNIIRHYTTNRKAVVAFSGGMDSTLALLLTKEVIPDITAVHIDWGEFTYPEIRKRIKDITQRFGIKLHVIYREESLRNLATRGISCNVCSRKIKLATIEKYYPDTVIITGANQSDSWGKGGIYFNPPFLAPLKDLNKAQEEKILRERYGINTFHIGVHPEREGCILRHLWTPDRHGDKIALTCKANKELLQYLSINNIHHVMANVKVIGNSKYTKLIINVVPYIAVSHKSAIEKLLGSKDISIIWGDTLSELTVVVNPSLYNLQGQESVKAIILSELAHKEVTIKFIRSKNDFIRLFQVVDAR